ncbi:MAG TPA: amidohydrolase family protein [Ilumatobacteraceae bacterium]
MSTTRDIPWLISVDDHVIEPPDLWQRWLPAGMRERGPRVVRASLIGDKQSDGGFKYRIGGDAPPVDVWVYEDLVKHTPTTMACAGLPRDELTNRPISYADMRPGFYDPVARLADMDTNRTEASLCFPTFPRFCGQTFLEAQDRELAHACVLAFNNWMVEEWAGGSGGRLLPLCIIPLWDARLAAAEVRRNAARGCRAVAFSELPTYLGLPSIHHNAWDPLFEACAETGTVVCMHIGSGTVLPMTSADAPNGVRISLTSINAQMSMTDWLLSGVLARYPSLRIAYSEGQIGWMPYVLERVDNVFHKSRKYAGLDPAITEPPSTYARGRIYGCFFEDDHGIAVRDIVGIDQITFETDYPHQDTTWPNTGAAIDRFAAQLSDEELYKILRGNAIEMLGLDLDGRAR